MSAGVQGGQRGADRDGFAGADLAGDDPEGVLVDAPGDAGAGFGVAGVAVQHAGGEVTAEGGAGETVVCLQPFGHRVTAGEARLESAGGVDGVSGRALGWAWRLMRCGTARPIGLPRWRTSTVARSKGSKTSSTCRPTRSASTW